jgi:MYXO-CTERM domain-containing protein
MKNLSVIAGVCAALGAVNNTNAAYVGLSTTSANATVALDPLDPTTLTPVTIHRVWATFTNAADALFVWGGGGGLGTGVINNINATGSGPGSGFLNNTVGGDLPPNTSAAVSNSDTFFTIGVTLQNQIPAGQAISLLVIPGTPGGLTGNTINLSPQGGGVTTTPTTGAGAPNPIATAGFTGDGDTALRVLLMQLVVNQGENVSGTIGITINLGGLAGATSTIQNQMFGPLPPSPGALPALALGALFVGRRRRAP